MLVLLTGVLALLSPALFGGRLSRLASVSLRGRWIPFGCLAAQIVVMEVVTGPRWLLAGVHLVTYVLAAVFLWLNRHVAGLTIVALGASCNALAITVNGGTLPASPDALATAGIVPEGHFANSASLADPKLTFLGDVFAVPASWPLANVFSVGDVLIVVGALYGAHRICGSRLLPRRQQPSPPGQRGAHDEPVPAPTVH